MIGLASGLLALAGLFAGQAARSVRRADVSERLGLEPVERPRRRLPKTWVWFAVPVVVALAGAPVPALGLAASAIVVGRALDRRRRTADRRRREEQLADAVAALAAGLRAGLSLPQSFAYARDEAQMPLREDLARLVDGIDVGRPVGEALHAWAEGLRSEDAMLIAGVLELHRRSGGDLPSVLDGLVATLRERRAADREVRAFTAQARMSGLILGTLPIGFFGFLLLTSRREMVDAMGTTLGRVAVAVGLGLETLAFLWIRRLLEVR